MLCKWLLGCQGVARRSVWTPLRRLRRGSPYFRVQAAKIYAEKVSTVFVSETGADV